LLGLKQYYSAGEVIKVYHAESGFAVECWFVSDVRNKFEDSELFKAWLQKQVVHAYDFEVLLEGVHHKPSNSLARSWGDLVQRFSYREWFYEYLPDCDWVRNTWTLHHKPTGIKVRSLDLWHAIDDLIGETAYVEWLKGGVMEWKAERTNDGWVNVTHGPTGMSISSMFDIRDCVETITGSEKYVDWVCDQVEFEEDDFCILWTSGWYLHVPTGKTSETLEGLMVNIYADIYGSTEFVWFSGCVRHKASGIVSYNLMNLITSAAFLEYLEDRVYVM